MHHSFILVKTSSGWCITIFGPSATMFKSLSVTITATSSKVSILVSKPVISQSTHTKRVQSGKLFGGITLFEEILSGEFALLKVDILYFSKLLNVRFIFPIVLTPH